MGLKKRNKPNAEFSMSSLTDIIFLLLIFFMLTSTLVKLDAFDLPESNNKTVAPVDIIVGVQKGGKYTLNNTPYTIGKLEAGLRSAIANSKNKKNATVTIASDKNIPWKHVSKVVAIAGKLRVRAILATKTSE